MTELSKYDIIFEELGTLEKQVSNLVNRNRELAKENTILQARVKELEEKESVLVNEVEELKRGGIINLKERESLKLKLNELVNKIDFHLRS